MGELLYIKIPKNENAKVGIGDIVKTAGGEWVTVRNIDFDAENPDKVLVMDRKTKTELLADIDTLNMTWVE